MKDYILPKIRKIVLFLSTLRVLQNTEKKIGKDEADALETKVRVIYILEKVSVENLSKTVGAS